MKGRSTRNGKKKPVKREGKTPRRRAKAVTRTWTRKWRSKLKPALTTLMGILSWGHLLYLVAACFPPRRQ